MSVGGLHTCATRTDGSLWCWGNGTNGQLGLGDIANRTSPTQVGILAVWYRLATGLMHTCATRTDGSLWCWGFNGAGQLGMGTAGNATAPLQVGSAMNWAGVSAESGDASCARAADGSLWCWGTNRYGQLGLGSTNQQLAPVQVLG